MQIGNRHSTVARVRETCAYKGTVIAMEAAPQNELDVLGIRKVCCGKGREVFQTLDWDKILPSSSLPENVMRKDSGERPRSPSLPNWQTPELMAVASA
jgi:hypothetical protein